jgi:hypothetical protein
MFEGTVPAQVRVGRVTLTGEVEWDYQKHEIERMIRHVHGVAGINSIVAVTTKVSPHQIEANIEEAFSARPGWTPATSASWSPTTRQALRPRPLDERGEHSKGGGRIGTRHCQGGELSRRHPVNPSHRCSARKPTPMSAGQGARITEMRVES